MSRKEITIIGLKILSIAFITVLFFLNKINQTAFIILFIALYFSDNLELLEIFGLKIKLKEAIKEAYAKAEAVKKLGEALADLTAYHATIIGHWAPKNLLEKMLECRDKITAILKEIGSNEAVINQICSQINDTFLRDLKNEVYNKLQQITHTIFTNDIKLDRNKIHDKAQKLLFDNYDRAKLINYLKEQGCYQNELEPLLDKVDKFIRDKTL